MILSNNGIIGPPRKSHDFRESPHNEDFVHTIEPTGL
jgi:hypothetical protein